MDKIQADVEKPNKNHQHDPNLVQEKLDEITTILATGDGEVQKDFATESPYKDVQAAVREIDNEEYANTVRAWVLGLLFVTIVSGVNMFLSMRSPAITIPAVVVILITYPVGVWWAKIMPSRKFSTFGVEWTLNPGPFSVKEHAVITLMAKITADYPYSTNALEALQAPSLYNHNLGWGFALLFTLSSQIIGISMSGMFRRFLVWPSSMLWPGQFGTTSLLYTLHDKSSSQLTDADRWRISRYRWFCYIAMASFVYYWIPGILWQGLSVFAFITWITPNNVTVNQLFGGVTGLSLLPITFDWTYISAYLLNPLLSPWQSHLNCFIGLGIFVIIPTIGMVYTNTFFADFLPVTTSRTYDNTGARYNVSRILTPEFTFDEQAYNDYSPMFIAPTFFLNYGLSFATLTAALVHTFLNHRKEIWYRFKAAQDQEPDVHMNMMKRYAEAPDWWYGCVWVGSMALGLATVLVYPSQLPWWGFLVSCIIAFVFIIPLAMILGMTNILISLNVLSPFLGGYMLPGRPIANMLFKVFSTIVLGQAQVFSGDLKFAHYMKIPPRTTFFCQISAAIWSVFVQISVMNWALGNIPKICEPDQPSHFTCPNGSTFFSSSIVWGVIGPQRFLGAGSVYEPIHYFWLLGAALPVLFFFAQRRFPKSIARFLHAPVMLGAMAWLPPATPLNFSTWAIVGLVFNWWIRKRYNEWWMKYNYITAAGLDVGLILCTLIIFFAFSLPGITVPQWWGNVTVFETLDAMGMAIKKVLAPGETFGPSSW
ncbi:small oligopeptide transporter [Stachybotrys elegans]|uniref:Small oligopeptide transporter n=1 Tax=Stachybotrys elegans TaxID=80388 RepID=A0A8K0STI6_9HYPO|nr:small oligopeptide transporter [Stachybotrys elegans]